MKHWKLGTLLMLAAGLTNCGRGEQSSSSNAVDQQVCLTAGDCDRRALTTPALVPAKVLGFVLERSGGFVAPDTSPVTRVRVELDYQDSRFEISRARALSGVMSYTCRSSWSGENFTKLVENLKSIRRVDGQPPVMDGGDRILRLRDVNGHVTESLLEGSDSVAKGTPVFRADALLAQISALEESTPCASEHARPRSLSFVSSGGFPAPNQANVQPRVVSVSIDEGRKSMTVSSEPIGAVAQVERCVTVLTEKQYALFMADIQNLRRANWVNPGVADVGQTVVTIADSSGARQRFISAGSESNPEDLPALLDPSDLLSHARSVLTPSTCKTY